MGKNFRFSTLVTRVLNHLNDTQVLAESQEEVERSYKILILGLRTGVRIQDLAGSLVIFRILHQQGIIRKSLAQELHERVYFVTKPILLIREERQHRAVTNIIVRHGQV